MTGPVLLTIVLALAAACCYALSNVLEQSEAEQMPEELALRPTLLVRLSRRPRWLLGFASDACGYGLSAGALAFGAVVFVQPILSTGLLISLLLASLFGQRPMRPRDWFAALILSSALVVFLLEVSPTGGHPVAPLSDWAIAGPVIAGTAGICVACGWRWRGPRRAALLAVAAGIMFATSAVLTKAFVHYLGDGVFGWVGHWEPYAMAVVTMTGFLLAQTSFQAGALAASVAGLEATEPLTAIALGLGLLDEHVNTSGTTAAALVAVSAAAIVWAIAMLSIAEARTIESSHATIDLTTEPEPISEVHASPPSTVRNPR